jgi:hypothetical protein
LKEEKKMEKTLVYEKKFKAHGETYQLKIYVTENGLIIEVTLNGELCLPATISIGDSSFYIIDNRPIEELYLYLSAFVESLIKNKTWKKRFDAAKAAQKK